MTTGARTAALAAILIGTVGLAPACGQPCALEPCDVRDGSCRRGILDAVICVRGGEPRDVPVHVVDADDYIDERARAEEGDDRAWVERWYRGLGLLRLSTGEISSSEATRQSLATVAGFYDPDERAITLLDRGAPIDGLGSALLLAHEYVHALQDQEHDLTRLYEEHGRTVDARLGLSAAIEGEAVLYGDRLHALSLGFAEDEVDWAAGFAAYRESSRLTALAHPEPALKLQSLFVYGFGGVYVHDVYRRGGDAAVRELLAEPPASARAVMTGPFAPPPGGEPWVEPELDAEAVPVIDPAFEAIGSGHLGSYALYLFLSRWDPAWQERDPLAHPAVRHLRADAVSVLRPVDGEADSGATVVGWRLRFAGERDAQRLIDDVGARFERDDAGGRVVRRAWASGRDAFFLAAAPAAEFTAPLEPTAWVAIPEPEPDQDAEAAARAALRSVVE